MTNTTPKQLTDLKFQEWVFTVKNSIAVEIYAENTFKELFGEEYEGELKINFLFQEQDDFGRQVKVYEAYKDSGSVDYIYLKKY